MTGPTRRTLRIITAALAGLALAFSLNPTATAFDRDNRQAFIKAARATSAKAKLSKVGNAALVRIGTAFCDDNTSAAGLNAILRANRLALNTMQRIQIANVAYSKLCPGGYASPLPKLVMPENSGWTLTTSQYGLKSLVAPATVGVVLPLGNAPALGIKIAAGACGDAWYDSAFITLQFLDADGAPVLNQYGHSEVGLGYRPGIDNISGCGTEDVSLAEWPSAAFVKVTSNTSTTPEDVSLRAHDHL